MRRPENPPRRPVEPWAILLERIPSASAVLETGGTIVAANARFRAVLALAPRSTIESALGSEALALVSDAAALHPGESLAQVLHDGTARSWRFAAEPLPSQGTPRVLAVLEAIDVVDPPRAPIDADELALESDASALRHALSGPITAILGTAELALMRESGTMSAETREALEQIMEACGRISDLLARSRDRERSAQGGGQQ